MNDKIVNNNHEVKMIDRCILNITGIKKIINFDNKEFIIESVMGPIHIKGENMELLNILNANKIDLEYILRNKEYIVKIK